MQTSAKPNNTSIYRIHIILFVCLASFFFLACEKEDLYTSGDANLGFSHDTLYFDTVFTAIGSVTKFVKIYNPYKKSVQISSIRLAGGHHSFFRLNIDGGGGPEVSNIILQARDSLYIFVEVTIDPTSQNSPLAVQDSILFETNGNTQALLLLAWGQDVHLIDGQILHTQTWTADKPYLIYNSMFVEEGHVLSIEAGVRLHFHRNSRMYVAGTVKSLGTPEHPVVFEGDRLEEAYKNIPGQWEGIWLMPGSLDNEFYHSRIRNAVNGIWVDTLASELHPTLRLGNVRIENMSSAGIYAQGSTIHAYNCIISDCGKYAVALTIGGRYEFYHCTFANYWNYSARRTPSIVLNNFYVDVNQNIQVRPLEKAIFGNCIIYGDRTEELAFNFYPQAGSYNYFLDHCLIRLPENLLEEPAMHRGLILNTDPRFTSVMDKDYSLDSLSVAIDAGLIDYALLYPLDQVQSSRTSDAGPDLGALERVE
jgi:hypothetical protein